MSAKRFESKLKGVILIVCPHGRFHTPTLIGVMPEPRQDLTI